MIETPPADTFKVLGFLMPAGVSGEVHEDLRRFFLEWIGNQRLPAGANGKFRVGVTNEFCEAQGAGNEILFQFKAEVIHPGAVDVWQERARIGIQRAGEHVRVVRMPGDLDGVGVHLKRELGGQSVLTRVEFDRVEMNAGRFAECGAETPDGDLHVIHVPLLGTAAGQGVHELLAGTGAVQGQPGKQLGGFAVGQAEGRAVHVGLYASAQHPHVKSDVLAGGLTHRS